MPPFASRVWQRNSLVQFQYLPRQACWARWKGGRGVALVRTTAAASPEPERVQPTGSLAASSVAKPSNGLAHFWPTVSWSRYHLQVLFVDRTDTVRARLAAGLFERCAEWNGCGRTLVPWTCGLSTRPSPPDVHSVSKLAALLVGAVGLQLLPRSFTRPPEAFEPADLSRYDLLVALDRGVLAGLVREVEAEWPEGAEEREAYMQKLCLLTSFSHYECDEVLTRRGGTALLPGELSARLSAGPGGLQALKAVQDIASPDLSAPDGAAQWEGAVGALVLSTASLVKYCMDAYPEHMPHWDPVD